MAPGNDLDDDLGQPDVAAERVAVLLQCQLEGNATDAETEELTLYAEERPDLRAHIENQVARGNLGHGWLERVRKDEAIATVENTSRARVERGVGLAMILGGFAAAFFTPVGGGVVGMGLLILLYSVVRVRLATHANDPYKDIVR
ncbi:MAG: hypothetical protein JKY37_19300 [Nannocystaceae bacterium]|nr:hypothetical protein [Nannocystaceae bacterium]